MERNGWIWDIFLKADLEGFADGLLVRSRRKRGIKKSLMICEQKIFFCKE